MSRQTARLGYNLLLGLASPTLRAYTHRRARRKGLEATRWRESWGAVAPATRAWGERPGTRIWVHAVSVGEVMAAQPLLRALREAAAGLERSDSDGGVHLALSCSTASGHAVASGLVKRGEIDVLFTFPFDTRRALIPVLEAVRAHAIVTIETELWPNLLHEANARGTATLVANGRVSDNLLVQARRMGPLWRWLHPNVSLFLMRAEEDAARLRSLGVEAQRVEVTGDIKLEAPLLPLDRVRSQWRARLGLGASELLLLGGSTHPGEEAWLLDLASHLGEPWRLALAPRHVERRAEVENLIRARGRAITLRSSGNRIGPGEVLLIDTVGELADLYAAADVAFVGGTLIQRGGHNLLEPVQRGTPVLFGPSVDNFRTAAALVEKNALGERLPLTLLDARSDSDQTCAALTNQALERAAKVVHQWAGLPRDSYSSRVQEALAPHRGAAHRAATRVLDLALAARAGNP